MFHIVKKKCLAQDTNLFEIKASHVALNCQAGQFIVLMNNDTTSERIPLSLAGWDRDNGTIKIVCRAVGRATIQLNKLKEGDEIAHILGPLGNPIHIEKYPGLCVCIGGGYGAAPLITISKALKEAGNKVYAIVGARTKELLILTDELARVCDRVIITTDDGSFGMRGVVTDALAQLIKEDQVSFVEAIGPIPMMKAVANLTKQHKIKTYISVNPIMLDATGLCGVCRVSLDGKTRFACIDGPDFDAHSVDLDELATRLAFYRDKEIQSLEFYKKSEISPKETPACASHADRPLPITTTSDNTHPLLPEGISLDQLLKISNKDRMRVPRQPVPEQSPSIRIRNFDEVSFGLTEEQAIVEASRCIMCRDAPCIKSCPVGVKIPDFILKIREKSFTEALEIIFQDNLLPAICGRVCPQEKQCEAACVTGKKGQPINIGKLERFAADWAFKNNAMPQIKTAEPSGFKVAVVGSGPAGLTCAAELVKLGHKVIIFEALHKPGGVLMYGIPPFRLPRWIIDLEVGRLKQLGVEFRMNHLIGRTFTIDQLQATYDAIFLATGAGLPHMLSVPGENLKGVFTANEFLTRVNLMQAHRFPHYETPLYMGKRIAVIGCGDTAMDAARSPLRLGAEKSMIIYRRGKEDAPARDEEIEHAKQEGVEFHWFTTPARFESDTSGFVRKMFCVRTEPYGPPDASGKRPVKVVPDSEHEIDVDTVILAIGFGVNPLIAKTTPDIAIDEKRRVVKVDTAYSTTKDGVFAGGDVITGGATVILAMGQGKNAAQSIDNYLKTMATRKASTPSIR